MATTYIFSCNLWKVNVTFKEILIVEASVCAWTNWIVFTLDRFASSRVFQHLRHILQHWVSVTKCNQAQSAAYETCCFLYKKTNVKETLNLYY